MSSRIQPASALPASVHPRHRWQRRAGLLTTELLVMAFEQIKASPWGRALPHGQWLCWGQSQEVTGASSSLAVQEISMEKLHLPAQPNGPDPLLHTCYKHMPERIGGALGKYSYLCATPCPCVCLLLSVPWVLSRCSYTACMTRKLPVTNPWWVSPQNYLHHFPDSSWHLSSQINVWLAVHTVTASMCCWNTKS